MVAKMTVEAAKAAEVKKAKEILSKVDPRVAMTAIMRSDKEIKEVLTVSRSIRSFDRANLLTAFSELYSEGLWQEAVSGKFGYCNGGPDPGTCGSCIVRMEFGMFDELIKVANYRSAKRALEMNRELGEL